MNKLQQPAIVYILAVILSACSSSAPVCQSGWQAKPVTVDGRASEWTIPLQYYDDGTKLNYTVSNDDTNLYYCIRIADDKEEMRVMRAGMQFWIDTTGKNEQQVGIQFPFPQLYGSNGSSANSNYAKNGRKNSFAGDSGRMQRWSGHLGEMRLTGFKYPIEGVTSIPNIYGIKVSIARDSSGVTIYEACIPFKTFYKPVLSSADNNKMLGITIIVNPMQSSGHSGGGHRGGGGGGMSMGGRMGMGGGGHRGGNEGDDEGSTETASTLKLKLKLTAR